MIIDKRRDKTLDGVIQSVDVGAACAVCGVVDNRRFVDVRLDGTQMLGPDDLYGEVLGDCPRKKPESGCKGQVVVKRLIYMNDRRPYIMMHEALNAVSKKINAELARPIAPIEKPPTCISPTLFDRLVEGGMVTREGSLTKLGAEVALAGLEALWNCRRTP